MTVEIDYLFEAGDTEQAFIADMAISGITVESLGIAPNVSGATILRLSGDDDNVAHWVVHHRLGDTATLIGL